VVGLEEIYSTSAGKRRKMTAPTVNDQRRPVEEDAGDFIGMWPEFLASHHAVKDEARIRLSAGLSADS